MHAKETPNGEAKDTLKKSIAHIIFSLFLLFYIGGASVYAQQVDSLQLDTMRPKKESSIKAPIHYQASDSMVMMGNGTAFLHGSGDLKYETMQLTGDFIRMNIDIFIQSVLSLVVDIIMLLTKEPIFYLRFSI